MKRMSHPCLLPVPKDLGVPLSAPYHRKLSDVQTRTEYTVISPQKCGPKPRKYGFAPAVQIANIENPVVFCRFLLLLHCQQFQSALAVRYAQYTISRNLVTSKFE